MDRRTNNLIQFDWARLSGTHKFTLSGREAWALHRLIEAGEVGVTPVSEPTGPRWSAYIHKLRRAGLEIETITETHGGPFPGTHARYVLHSKVSLSGGGRAGNGGS